MMVDLNVKVTTIMFLSVLGLTASGQVHQAHRSATIPPSLHEEHEEIHETLVKATGLPGPAARLGAEA